MDNEFASNFPMAGETELEEDEIHIPDLVVDQEIATGGKNSVFLNG